MKRYLVLPVFLFLLPAVSADDNRELSLTVYYNNLALIKDVRSIEIDSGYSDIEIKEIASKIKDGSMNFRNLGKTELTVIEQVHLYDLGSLNNLLTRYLGSIAKIHMNNGLSYSGQLLSYVHEHRDGNVFLDDVNGGIAILSMDDIATVDFPHLPGAIIKEPKLKLKIYSESAGLEKCEISYLAENFRWLTNYVAIVSDDDSGLNLSSMVSITNNTSIDYKNASLTLVAGYVHRERGYGNMGEIQLAARTAPRPGRSFEESQFFEYYMYSLYDRIDLDKYSTKEIALMPSAGIKVDKTYTLDTHRSSYSEKDKDKLRIRVNLGFDNSVENGLGMPLPKGMLRVYKEDRGGELRFVGEDAIEHTPVGEKVLIYVGDAYDLTAYHKIVNVEKKSESKLRETYEVTIENHKQDDITVTVIDHPKGWDEWKIIDSSHEYRKVSNFMIEFIVDIKSGGESKIFYTIDFKKY